MSDEPSFAESTFLTDSTVPAPRGLTKRLQLAALNERIRKDPTIASEGTGGGPHTARGIPAASPGVLLTDSSPRTERSKALPPVSRIHVAVRKRPMTVLDEQLDPRETVEVDTSTSLCVHEPCRKVDLTPFTETHSYVLDASYDHKATNLDVYRGSIADVVRCIVEDGGRGTVFAIGSSGTGKTHSIFGSEYEPGLYRMAAGDVFRSVRQGTKVFVSLYELCGATISDLLNEATSIACRQDANGHVHVGAVLERVESAKALAAVVSRGLQLRQMRHTAVNDSSSRSHAVLTLTLRRGTEDHKLSFVDLAGADRSDPVTTMDKASAQRTSKDKDFLAWSTQDQEDQGEMKRRDETQKTKDAKDINKSLLALRECILAMGMGSAHVPYRSDKLTEILRECFTGRCHSVMLANVSSAVADIDATLNTIRFAYKVRQLQKGEKTPKETKDGKGKKASYRLETPTDLELANKEVSLLRAELHKKEVAHTAEVKLMQDRIRLLMRENERLRRRY